MPPLYRLAVVFLVPLLASAADCSAHANTVSCGAAADPCCVPAAGRFVFRQRFEPDEGDAGEWGIEGIDVLECDGSPATVGGRKRTHEEIGSLCARTARFDVEENEGAWAASEVGEGVEEVWERVWNTAGRFVTSLCDGDADVPRFFDSLLELHKRMQVGAALDHADITPSPDTEYSLSDVSAALEPFGTAIPRCTGSRLTHVLWPLHSRGNLAGWVSAPAQGLESNCPAEGIVYPPATVIPPTSKTTWDPVYRPSMRPITASHDESKRVKYDDDDDEKKKGGGKLGFFKSHDARRYGERDEL